MKLENLIKVKSYADMKGVTVPWIWRVIKGGKLECFFQAEDGIRDECG